MFTETSHGEAACPPYTAQPGTSRERACAFGETRGHGTGVATGMLRERAGVFSLRGTAGQRPRKPAAPGAAWSSSKACHAELRHLSRHSPSPRPDGHFPSVAERDTAGAFPGAFPGASSGASPGAFPRAFPRALPVLYRSFTEGFPGGLFRGLSRGLCARKCDVYPKHGPSSRGLTFSVCTPQTRRTGRGVVFVGGLARRSEAYPQHSPSPLPDRPSPSVTANPPRDTSRGKAGVLLHHPPFPVAARDRT